MKEEYIVDDRFIIPEDIKRMSKAELEAEIARLEKEERAKKKTDTEPLPDEIAAIEQAEKDIANGDVVDLGSVNWD